MPDGLRVALFIVAAVLAFVQAFRGVAWSSARVPHLGWLAFTSFVIPFAWDAAEVWSA